MNLLERVNTMELLEELIASPRCEALDNQVKNIPISIEVRDGGNYELIFKDVTTFEEVTAWIDDGNYVFFLFLEDNYIFNQCVEYFNR